MPGTVQPPAGTNISELNPCPLNVCCNIWGQCGMTDDFCTVSKSETGAPGTSAPGVHGCISNCGRDIIKGSAPASRMTLGYFEGWNHNRPCLTMDVDQIDTSQYTHIHFAFPNVTHGTWEITITDPLVQEQFTKFKELTGVKKVVSLGGWDFSALPGTFHILREAAQPANRDAFKAQIIRFINEHGLDGIDLDWEYPGAPDIPDIPSDDPVNGMNYYRLLASIKAELGSSKTVSFAAPASYWYLRAFPIKQMASALDYIVFMTYDLHGQWDAGNKWTSPGCPTGACLRSHVNETETKDALSMITKAGASTNKILVGVSSYGRSFKMAQSGCDGPDCTFLGDNRNSQALPGRCTGTGGYISDAEIDEIIAYGNVKKQWKEEGSDIMVYNDTEWVAWMSPETKAERRQFYDSYNFLGTTDWAIDLQEWVDGTGDDGSEWEDEDKDGYFYATDYWAPCPGSFSTLQQLEDRKGSIPAHCMDQYIFDVQVAVYEASLKKYKKLLEDGYDKKFQIWEGYLKDQIPDQFADFMNSDKMLPYFECTEKGPFFCCESCRYGLDCSGCKTKPACLSTEEAPMAKCPKAKVDLDPRHGGGQPTATFKLIDEDGFHKAILDEAGVEADWVSWPKETRIRNNPLCATGRYNCELLEHEYFYNWPRVFGSNVDILNPKDTVEKAIPDADGLLQGFKMFQAIGLLEDEADMADLADATSLPAFAVEEAVSQMEKIVEEAKGIEKARREAFILNLIMSILFFLPFAGPVARAISPGLRVLLRAIGRIGEAGLLVYEAVNAEDGAFVAVLAELIGGLGRRGKNYKDAASHRRGMSKAEYESLGNVKTKLDTVNGLRSGKMCKI